MKFISIAVASVAYMAASASAFSWGCQDEHTYGAKDIVVDIKNAKSSWNKGNTFSGTVTKDGTWLRVTCTKSGGGNVSPTLKDCADALDWLWNTVNDPNGNLLDKKGLVPRTCNVNNDSITVKWSNK
ncbi:hypothetical protein B0O80DRAFT_462747 [Mortierella sp. GBAus27b]|nr:hypothetical protein BGX31_002355 [Mortierella sp. GBA43]KAG0208317.1 hypothetical protein BGX31_002356 [Mortierella sp. GBA43]KAI8348312.1 hypothetical protein B0O80DRAFT_462746 [Mortierella sp. GBAus27b]KAI8348313.1 hypothetical protein B0O80DRAFT_462747 [Mortierella sp. GBAus27b]